MGSHHNIPKIMNLVFLVATFSVLIILGDQNHNNVAAHISLPPEGSSSSPSSSPLSSPPVPSPSSNPDPSQAPVPSPSSNADDDYVANEDENIDDGIISGSSLPPVSHISYSPNEAPSAAPSSGQDGSSSPSSSPSLAPSSSSSSPSSSPSLSPGPVGAPTN